MKKRIWELDALRGVLMIIIIVFHLIYDLVFLFGVMELTSPLVQKLYRMGSAWGGAPFLFLSGGTHSKIHRMIGPQLGCVTYLAVQEHDNRAVSTQPTIKAAKAVRDHFDYLPDVIW